MKLKNIVCLCVIATLYACSGASKDTSVLPGSPSSGNLSGNLSGNRTLQQIATAGLPTHVQTWYEYGEENSDIPASYMAAHATYAEDDPRDVKNLSAFKSAGGQYAIGYINPSFVPYCSPPFMPPHAGKCKGPIGDMNPPESAWVHDSTGARIYRLTGSVYEEALNPVSSSVQQDVKEYSTQYGVPAHVDGWFSDDSGDTLDRIYYGFDAKGVSIPSDAEYELGENALISSLEKPTFLNGDQGDNGLPSYGGVFLKNGNVLGQTDEGCFNSYYGKQVAGSWATVVNLLLAIQQYGKKSVCMMEGPPTSDGRIYAYASWFMLYDPNLSVISNLSVTPDGHTILPEYAIVPTLPRESAGALVSTLFTHGVYVREFAACYQDTVSIGECAAIVNPGSSAVAMPPLTGHYTQTLTLDTASAYVGGEARWNTGIPTSIAADDAVIVSK